MAAGRAIELRGKLKKSPFDIAVQYGLRSLVALLALNVTDVSFKNMSVDVRDYFLERPTRVSSFATNADILFL
jgi:hypothetical protein